MAVSFRTLAWRDGVPADAPADIHGIKDALADPDLLLWADIVKPTRQDLILLAEELGVGRNALEDAVAPYERPKASQEDGYQYFVTYATLPGFASTADDEDDQLSRVAGFAFPGGLITVRRTGALDMEPVVRRWHNDRRLLRLGAPALVHGLLDVVVDGYFETVQELDDAIEELEDDLFSSPASHSQEFQRRAYDVRTKLVTLRRIVLPMREVVSVVWRHREDAIRELDAFYADLTDHVLRAGEWSESLRDMISTIFDTHLALQDARLNVVMKKLSGWAAVLAAITFVTGWFGQNVPFPGFGNTFGYVLTCLLTLGSGVGMWWIMRRHDWI